MVGLENLVTKLRSMNKVKVNHRIYCSSELFFFQFTYIFTQYQYTLKVKLRG